MDEMNLEETLTDTTCMDSIDVYAQGTTVLYTPPANCHTIHDPHPNDGRDIGMYGSGYGAFDEGGILDWDRNSLHKSSIGSQGSGFTLPSNLGIGGGGISYEIPGTNGLTERYMPDSHDPFGDHINYHNIIGSDKKKPIVLNDHIKGFDWEDLDLH